MRSVSASSCAIASSVAFMCVAWWRSISVAARPASQAGIIAKGRPAASIAIALATPKTPHSGGASSIVDTESIAYPSMTSKACEIRVRWSWSTNFGARVVPEVVKMAQALAGVAWSSASAGWRAQSA